MQDHEDQKARTLKIINQNRDFTLYINNLIEQREINGKILASVI